VLLSKKEKYLFNTENFWELIGFLEELVIQALWLEHWYSNIGLDFDLWFRPWGMPTVIGSPLVFDTGKPAS